MTFETGDPSGHCDLDGMGWLTIELVSSSIDAALALT